MALLTSCDRRSVALGEVVSSGLGQMHALHQFIIWTTMEAKGKDSAWLKDMWNWVEELTLCS